MNPVMKLICFATHTDDDLLQECTRRDYIATGWQFFRLLLQSALAFASMYYASSMITDSVLIRVGVALILALMIWSLDVAIASHDYKLTGVLAEQSSLLKNWAEFATRVAFALVLSLGLYAIPLELKLQEAAIAQQLEDNRRAKNQSYRDFMTELEGTAGAQATQLSDGLVNLESRLASVRTNIGELYTERQQLVAQRNASELEMQAQDDGLDSREEGKGPRYRQAKRKKQATDAIEGLSTKKRFLEEEEARLQKTILENQKRVETAAAEFEERAQAKKIQLTEEGIYNAKQKHGLLMRVTGLHQLKQDPEVGQAATVFGWILRSTLLLLEVMFVLIHIFLSQASLYNLKARLRTQQLAAENIHQFNETIKGLRAEAAASEVSSDHAEGAQQGDDEQAHGQPMETRQNVTDLPLDGARPEGDSSQPDIATVS